MSLDAHKGVSQITNEQLTAILKECIYGVDLNEEAVRVASFSLSLALCDFLDPRSIWNELSFPKLVNENLIVSDFFDNALDSRLTKYDIVIGNPPWQSQLTNKANNYLKENKYIVGDKQIAQAFPIKCASICKETGVVCLLMPSKGLLFNRSPKSRAYRRRFSMKTPCLSLSIFLFTEKYCLIMQLHPVLQLYITLKDRWK